MKVVPGNAIPNPLMCLRHLTSDAFGTLCSHLAEIVFLNFLSYVVTHIFITFWGFAEFWGKCVLDSVFTPKKLWPLCMQGELCPLRCSISMFFFSPFLWRILSFLELYIVRLFNVWINELLFAVIVSSLLIFEKYCFLMRIVWVKVRYSLPNCI